MHNFARNLFKPMLLLPLIAIGGCAGFDLSGQWGRENAIAGNYQHDYADLHFNGVRNLCVNLLLIRNFAGFVNRPQFARYLPARENGLKRGMYEQQALPRRIQDRSG
jgi:hypothetical protein